MLKKGDALYLYTDGITDQNNAKRKRFTVTRLKKELARIAHLDTAAQKDKLEEALDNHQQSEMQRDDITVLGMKI